MSPPRPGHIVEQADRLRGIIARRASRERTESGDAEGIRRWRKRGSVVEVLVDAEFKFVHEERRENVQHFENAVSELRVVLRPGDQLSGRDSLNRFIGVETDKRSGS